MIETLILSALIGSLCGALSCWLLKCKINCSRPLELQKKSYLTIGLPNGNLLTIWDSFLKEGQIVACCHHNSTSVSVIDGDLVYFADNKIASIVRHVLDV